MFSRIKKRKFQSEIPGITFPLIACSWKGRFWLKHQSYQSWPALSMMKERGPVVIELVFKTAIICEPQQKRRCVWHTCADSVFSPSWMFIHFLRVIWYGTCCTPQNSNPCLQSLHHVLNPSQTAGILITHVSRILRCPVNEAGVCQDMDSFSRFLKSIAVRQIRTRQTYPEQNLAQLTVGVQF